MELTEKEKIIIEWVKTPVAERKHSRRGLAQKLGVGIQFIDNIENSLPVLGADYDSVGFLKSRVMDADIALLESCLKGNAAAQKVLRQILGQLIEKAETKIKLEISAEDYAREHSENRRWLREHSFVEETGVGQVRSIPALLPENIRESAGQT